MTEDYRRRFGGLERIYGSQGLETLSRAHVAVIGLGGVGSWAVEALVRSGVGHMTLVDLDDLCYTNTNRQLPALEGQYGRLKTQALLERCRAINPEIRIRALETFYRDSRAGEILGQPGQPFPGAADFPEMPPLSAVLDAIDSVPDKLSLVIQCHQRGIPLWVSGGAGGKTDPARIRRGDLGQTPGDPLLKSLRQKLRKEGGWEPDSRGNYGQPCVFSDQEPVKPWDVCSTYSKPQAG